MVTTLYAGILGFLYIALSAYVIMGRYKHQVGLGDNGNPDLIKRIRIHANFIEYVPLALILMILVEFEGISESLIHAMGIVLVAGRLMHGVGITRNSGTSLWRGGGMILTFLVIIAASVLCIKSYFIF